MSQSPIIPQTELQRVVVEQALAYAQQLEQAAQNAPPSHLLDHCETVVLDSGREFLRKTLTAALQQQIHETEKKGAPPAPVLVASPVGTKALTRAR